MRIGMIGLGKLGLPVALAIDSRGHDVYGYDVNPDVNTYLSTKSLPYREEGIGPYLENNGIVVCGSIHSVVTNSEIVFLAIQTPHKPEYDGDDVLPADREDFNYQYLKEALTDIAKACYDLKKQTIVAVISTCLPGTFERELKPLLNDYVQYVYAPQFIAMGTVIDDYLNPEFNLIGVHHPEAAEVIEEFYLSINDAPPVKTDITTAEGIKLSYNAWITTKTVIANAWGEMSDKLGMNFDDIKLAWDMSTKRIVSSKYMNAGMSDGGGCFPPGELVMTRTGMRPIEAIDPGDEVLTAEGLFRPVVKRWERHYEGDLVSVQVRGLPPVRMTVDHPVLVRGDKLIPAEEICAAELTVDSLLGWPHIKDGSYPLQYPRYVELAEWHADDGLMVWRHVQKLDRERYSGPVYNLWVDEIHSYVVGCGAVSNCHPRDNIAMSWLANEIGMSHNIWDSLMQARQYYEGWHAEVAAETADETGLPLVLLGTAFKPETDIKAGSAAMLMANILRRRGVPFLHVDDLDPITIPAVYFIATQHARYAEYDWPQGSVVIDPFGYLEDRDGVEVIRLGREPR